MGEYLLGRRLRSERERRQITLESIAANTKINIGLLRDLERDDVSRWPGGIFRRSFVRTYAEAIGLDGDDIVHEFLERYPDAQQIEASAALVVNGELPSKAHPKTVLRLMLADTPHPFSGGPLLENGGARCKAAAWDIVATLALGAVAFLTLGTFWIPFAVVTLCYYAGGILILGNSPGVCLFAPKSHDPSPPAPTPDPDEGLDLPTIAATILR
jgi:transcriptional regulator with XRE-family HTH domain